MTSRFSCLGCQPSTLRTRSAPATMAGGSPARRGPSVTGRERLHRLHRLDDLEHGIALAIAAVEDAALAALAQMLERIDMGGDRSLTWM